MGSVEKRWGFFRLKINSFTLRYGKRLFEHVDQYSTAYTDIGLLLHSRDIPDFNGDTYKSGREDESVPKRGRAL